MMARHPLLRKFYYGVIGGLTAIAGWGIAITSYIDYRNEHRALAGPLVIIGLLLPFIAVGGEVYRYRNGAKKIRCLQCRNCGKELPLKAIYKTGRCPECNTNKFIAFKYDGGTVT